MATVKFTAFLGDVRGRIGDYVFSFQKGTHYYKAHNATVIHPNTYRQLQVRAFMSALSAAWDDLSVIQKDLWQNYATMDSRLHTGRGTFIALNLHLLAASHADLGCIYTPPPTPSTPSFPKGFCVFPMSSTVNCITWTGPQTTSDYLTIYFRLHNGFCLNFPTYGNCNTIGYRPSNRFITTVRSDTGSALHTHEWPSGARLYYKMRSIDAYGRQSPFTHEIRLYVP